MSYFSREVFFGSKKDVLPIRKVFRIEAKNKQEANEVLNKMVELYTDKLQGRQPINDVTKLKSIPMSVPSVSDKTVRMLKRVFKTKNKLK